MIREAAGEYCSKPSRSHSRRYNVKEPRTCFGVRVKPTSICRLNSDGVCFLKISDQTYGQSLLFRNKTRYLMDFRYTKYLNSPAPSVPVPVRVYSPCGSRLVRCATVAVDHEPDQISHKRLPKLRRYP